MSKIKLGILGSGGGTNAQSIMDSCASGLLQGKAEAVVVISNNSNARILERARSSGIPAVHRSSKTHPGFEELDAAIKNVLFAHGVDLMLLAGYMKKIGPQTLSAFPGRILNIHPALDLTQFGGEGLYGERVHQAVIAAGVHESGATVHIVNEQYDRGPVYMQIPVPVKPRDTPERLAARVLKQEHILYPKAVAIFIDEEWDIRTPTTELLQ